MVVGYGGGGGRYIDRELSPHYSQDRRTIQIPDIKLYT